MNKTIKNTLFIILLFFSMSFNFSFSQKTLKVNYLNDNGIGYTDITTTSKIWISSDWAGKTKIPLYLDTLNGVFKIDSLPFDCPYLHIKDQNGEIHIQKICMGVKSKKDWTIYIGSRDYLYHFEGYQPEPFIPSYNKLYVVFSPNMSIENLIKLQNKFGLQGSGGVRDLYELNTEKRTFVIKELSKMKEVYTLAPTCLFNRTERSYFVPSIQILLKDSLSNQEIKKLFNKYEISQIERFSPDNYIWKQYKVGIPYIITFKKGVMDYSLLKKLNELLLKNENVLVVKTSATITVTED